MAISKIPSAGFQDNVKFRNIVINGDMSISQRGISATGLGNGDNGYHTCDRWSFRESGSPTWEFTQTQSTDVPTGQGFAKSLKMDCTTADASPSSGDMCRIQQSFEGQNLQYLKFGTSSAQSTTVSFWVKSNKTGDYNVSLLNNDQSRIIGNTYTINSADTWEKKTITFAGDTAGAFDNDNNNSLSLWWGLLGGTDRIGGDSSSWGANADNKNVAGQTVNLADNTANEWYITGVQLEAGQISSEFEFLPHDVNLQRCSRYCFSVPYAGGDTYHGIMQGFFPNTTLFIGDIPLPTRMRDSISLTTSGSFGLAGTTDYSASSFTLENASLENSHSVEFRCTTSGVTAGQAARFRNQNDASAKFILTSEL